MKRERDSQRAKFYKAVVVLDKFSTPFVEMRYLHSFVDKINNNTMVRRRYPTVGQRITIKNGAGATRALSVPVSGTMSFPKSDRSTVSVLRMYSYILAYREDYRQAWHGWLYCSVLLNMVRFCIGKEAETALTKAFKNNGVRYRKPAEKTLTGQQRANFVIRGQKLAALKKDRQLRKKFIMEYPETVLLSRDEFNSDWETLYRLWRP